jgi:hypothetical protein
MAIAAVERRACVEKVLNGVSRCACSLDGPQIRDAEATVWQVSLTSIPSCQLGDAVEAVCTETSPLQLTSVRSVEHVRIPGCWSLDLRV